MDLTFVIVIFLTQTWIATSSPANKRIDRKNTKTTSKVILKRSSFRPVPAVLPQWPTRHLISSTPTNVKRVHLQSRTGYFLRLPYSGKIRGTVHKDDKYAQLIMESLGTSVVRFKGALSNNYLAMDRYGILYLSKTANNECLFKEKMEITDFHTFASYNYSGTNIMNHSREWYLAIKRNGKVRQALNTSKRQKAAQFMVVKPLPKNS